MSDGTTALAIELAALELDVIVPARPGGAGLEMLNNSNGMTELAASSVCVSSCCPFCCCCPCWD